MKSKCCHDQVNETCGDKVPYSGSAWYHTCDKCKKPCDIYDEEWETPCETCGTHDTFYKTVVNSPQWKLWEAKVKEELQKGTKGYAWDIDECRECNMISQEHLQAFLKFVVESSK